MVKDALELTQRTQIDGLKLSPRQLMMNMLVLRDQDKRQRIQTAEAVAVAMSGDEKLWKDFTTR